MIQDKAERLRLLKEQWSVCEGCVLHTKRTQTVFGYGNPDAQVVLVGEAPGATEDLTGEPFVGKAGRHLDVFLRRISLNEELRAVDAKGVYRLTDADRVRELLKEEFYFTNAVLCRPEDNRPPTDRELKTCHPRLVEVLTIIDPELIIAVGASALSAFLGKKTSIQEKRGDIIDVRLPHRMLRVRYPVIGIFHPSYLMRQNDYGNGSDAHRTYNDLAKAMQLVDDYNWRVNGIPVPKNRPPVAPITDETRATLAAKREAAGLDMVSLERDITEEEWEGDNDEERTPASSPAAGGAAPAGTEEDDPSLYDDEYYDPPAGGEDNDDDEDDDAREE